MVSYDNSRGAVCVHGAGGGGWEWTIWTRVLAARGWSVLAPDLQPAASGIATTSLDDYLAQVREWCTARPPDLLIGASLGGLLVLATAAQIRPRALVLVNPLPPRVVLVTAEDACAASAGVHTSDSADIARKQYPLVVPWGSARSLESTRRALPDADAATCLAAFRRWRDESGAVLNAAIEGVDILPPSCPMLVLASENDSDLAPVVAQSLAQQLRADFELLPRASHVGPLLGRAAGSIAQYVADWSEWRFREHNTR